MLRPGSPPIRPPIMRMHAYLASWHCTGRGWEEGGEGGGEGVVGPLTVRQSMRCKLPRRKNELRRRRHGTNERSATRVVKGPTHSDRRASSEASPLPSHPRFPPTRPHPSWPSILWKGTLRPGSAANQLTAKHVFLKYCI